MAKRPVFVVNERQPYFSERWIDFKYFTGFAESQRRKSVNSLQSEYISLFPNAKMLEVSRFSEETLGQRLSAFNLLGDAGNGQQRPVENIFQSSKVFENGGPFRDLLNVSPGAAKKDPRLQSSGQLVGFNYQGIEYPLEPKTFFYDWVYINALRNDENLKAELMKFNAFTDIVFNPEKSINCQARTIAIFVSLCKTGMLCECLKSRESFVELVYGSKREPVQLRLFCM